MWHWLSILAAIINFTGPLSPLAWAAPTSLGPTSSSEAAILWKDGQAAFHSEKYQEAINRLQRLVDRYPGYPDYPHSMEAYRLLGESYLLGKKPEKAIRPLRHFTATAAAALPAAQAGQGKLLLIKAYLATDKFHEAYLLSTEFERPQPAEALQTKEALLLKSRALMGLGRHSSAEPLLESLESDASLKQVADSQNTDYLGFRGELFLARLELKLHECGKLPSQGKMDEGQARLQLERRGACLQEAVIQYKKGLLEIQPRYLATAEPFLTLAFAKYHDSCQNPPPPPPLRPRDRTVIELRKYRQELVEALKVDCDKSFKSATDLLLKDAPTRPLAASIGKILEKATKVKHDQ